MTVPPRLFNCARCAQQVKICSHCDRGQVYCAGNCSLQARKESLNRAAQRYQTSQQGRLSHAARQAQYRARQQQKVTHQGSAGKADHGSLMQQLKRLLDGIESIKKRYHLESEELHTAWLLRDIREQKEIDGFAIRNYADRRYQVQSLRHRKLLAAQQGTSKKYHQLTVGVRHFTHDSCKGEIFSQHTYKAS